MTGFNPWQTEVKAVVNYIDPHGIYVKVRPLGGPLKNVSFFLFWKEGLSFLEDVDIVVLKTKRDDQWVDEAFWPEDVPPVEPEIA